MAFTWREKCLVVPFGESPKTQRQFFFQKYYEELFKPLGSKKEKVLEIGCGRCTIGHYFAMDGKDVECLDISPVAVDLANENFSRAGLGGRFEVADATHLKHGRYGRRFQDLIVSVGLIEHLEGGQWQKVFTEAHRALRPGGVLAMINVPKKFSIQTFFQKHDHYHREALTPEDYVKACYEAGFRMAKYIYVNPFPLVETYGDMRKEWLLTQLYRFIYWIRAWFKKPPIQGSKKWSQAHFLMAIK